MVKRRAWELTGLENCVLASTLMRDPSCARHRLTSDDGRAVAYDDVEYRRRAGIECGINVLKQKRASATRSDKHA